MSKSRCPECLRPYSSKYGRRNAKIRKMRDSGMTLREVGDHMGMSHENVRLICGNTGHLAAKVLREKVRAEPRSMTNEEIAEKYDLSMGMVSGLRTYLRPAVSTKHAPIFLNDHWVNQVYESFKKAGHDCELMPRHNGMEHDLIINGKRVRVSVCNSDRIPPSQKFRNPRRVFGAGSKNYDYLMCIIPDTEDTFVIPAEKIRPTTDGIVAFCWPTLRPTMSKYMAYHNASHLLGAP